MKKKALSLALALVMCLGLTVPAFAAEETLDMSGFQYIQVSKNPISWVHITGTDYYGNPVDVVYLMLEDDTIITVNVPADAKEDEGAQNLHSIHMGDGDGDTFSESFSEPVDNDFLWYLSYRDEVLLYGAESYISSLANDLGYKVERISAEKAAELNDDAARFLAKINKNTTPVQPNKPDDTKPDDTKPTTPVTPPADTIPASGTALASTQTVTVDGKAVEFQMYALADANGNLTNYIKLRDMAYVLNGTKAQFAVGYDGTISLTTGKAYEAGGTEMTTPYSGDRAYTGGPQTLKVDGKDVTMTAITLTDDNGGGYNYFKLCDLGKALGFNVGYSNENGVFIESDKPYAE